MLLALVLVAATSPSAVADAQQASPELRLRVVVHRSNAVSSLSRAEVSAIFMKKTRAWPGGAEIVAVDQPPRAQVREDFSRMIHGKSVAYVTRYWQRLIFAGRGIPPREARGDAEVMAFVAANPGAVGYVNGSAPLTDGVKAIAVTP